MPQPPRTSQTQAELEQHLKDQVAFLRASCQSYDNGFEGEAKRLALAIRILVHDTGKSHSLLTQLGVKNTLLYYDVKGPSPSLPTASEQSTHFRVVVSFGAGLQLSSKGFRFVPTLGKPVRQLSFEDWWSQPIMVRSVDNIQLSRKDIILNVANTDGGGHVESYYRILWMR